jgi:hypothetical protein
MTDVTPNLKAKAECQGNQEKCGNPGCPIFGTLGVVCRDGGRRVKGCGDPVARGKRNRTKGDSKARAARKTLAISGVNSRHEELLGGALRVEFKAGGQIAPAYSAFVKCEQQSEAARSHGDTRPFAAVFLPDGSRDGVVAFRLSDAFEVAAALLENMGAAS